MGLNHQIIEKKWVSVFHKKGYNKICYYDDDINNE